MTTDPARPELLIETQGHVRILTLNRPESLNALSSTLMVKLTEAVLDAEEEDEVRVVVITGSGDSVFCAGLDLKEMNAQNAKGQRFRPPTSRVERSPFEVVLEMKKPCIAALNGTAVGGGFELALACDLRVGHTEAKFGLPEVKIGMGAHFASAVLPRRIAPAVALELLMTGEFIEARRALEIGYLSRLVPPGRVMSEALELAQQIAGNAPISVRRVKAVTLRGLDMAVSAALRMDPGMSPYESEDRKEGIQARLEKRKPVWKNR